VLSREDKQRQLAEATTWKIKNSISFLMDFAGLDRR
jgi:hypothetical protein